MHGVAVAVAVAVCTLLVVVCAPPAARALPRLPRRLQSTPGKISTTGRGAEAEVITVREERGSPGDEADDIYVDVVNFEWDGDDPNKGTEDSTNHKATRRPTSRS